MSQRFVVLHKVRSQGSALHITRPHVDMIWRRVASLLLLLFACFGRAGSSPLFHHSHKKLRGAALSGDRFIRPDGPPTDALGKALEADKWAFSFFASQNGLKLRERLVATFTTGDDGHWQLFRNLQAAVTAQGYTLVTFVHHNTSLVKCRDVQATCFWPEKTLEYFKNQTVLAGKEFVVGSEEHGTEAHSAAVALKPAVLFLSSTLNRDFLFVETGAPTTPSPPTTLPLSFPKQPSPAVRPPARAVSFSLEAVTQ